jgi:hypothetical protein
MPKFVNRTVPGKDRMIGKLNQSSWANARDAASGTAASDTGDPINVRNAKTTSGGTKYHVTRAFIAFDTSDIKDVPTHAKLDLSISSLVGDGTGFRVVKVQAGATGDSDTAFAAADFDALQGFSSGATMAGNVVTYSPEITAASLAAGERRLVHLNAAARRDMAALDEFKLVVVGVKDYTNTASTADKRTLIDSVDDSTAANRPLLRWVEASGARKVRTTKGARTRGFKTRNVNITTGGKTVANGFSDD